MLRRGAEEAGRMGGSLAAVRSADALVELKTWASWTAGCCWELGRDGLMEGYNQLEVNG